MLERYNDLKDEQIRLERELENLKDMLELVEQEIEKCKVELGGEFL